MKPQPVTASPDGGADAGPQVRDHVTCPADVVLHPDNPMAEAVARLREAGRPFAPVVDGDAIVGVLSLRMLEAEPDNEDGTVFDGMHPTVPFLYLDDPLALGASIAAHTEIRHFCVVDRAHLLVGILSFDPADREGSDDGAGNDPLPLPAAVPAVAPETARRRLAVPATRAAGAEPGLLDTYAEGPTLYVEGRHAHEPLDRPDPESRRRREAAMKSKL